MPTTNVAAGRSVVIRPPKPDAPLRPGAGPNRPEQRYPPITFAGSARAIGGPGVRP